MKNNIIKLYSKIQHFMIGRYGTDELSRFLIRAAVVVLLISCIPRLSMLVLLALALAAIAVYRSISKRITARCRERDIYLKLTYGLRTKLNTLKRMWADRKTHRYFRCPKCKAMVRVPKGKGKIEITCTKCRNTMIRRS